jgi:dephospho-CoA kinase
MTIGVARREGEESAETGGKRLVVGLTGSIASGKSTVASLLGARGAEVIDADAVYRSLLESERSLSHRIIARFGEAISAPDGRIDRRKLAAVVFRDERALQDLEQIAHPTVVAEIRRRIAHSRAPVIVVEAVKLVQSGLLDDVDRLWHVTAAPDVRLRRLMARNDLCEREARELLAALPEPLPVDTPVDATIDNSGDIALTAEAVDRAWQELGFSQGAGLAGDASRIGREDA